MHISVMVFGDDVERQLAPYKDANVEPISAEYMQQIDCTDDVHELFQARQQYFRLSDGRYVERSDAHYRDASGKMNLIPGTVAMELSADEARCHGVGYPTLDAAAQDLGAEREGDRYIILDNPNSRWDWWVVGGRWGSMLPLLPGRQGYTAVPLESDPEFAKILNEAPPAPWQPTPVHCDRARKRDIDWVGMAAAAGRKAGALWDLVHSWTKGASWSTWAEVREKFPVEVAHHHYMSQPAIKSIREGQQTLPPERRDWNIDDAWSGTREDCVAAAEANAGVTFAVVFNGEWLQSDDHSERAHWNELFRTILAQVPDEAMVTIVDCHV